MTDRTSTSILYPSWADLGLEEHDPLHVDAESILVARASRLMKRDWALTSYAEEVASHGRARVDIACTVRVDQEVRAGTNRELLLGVEAKLTNWAKAFRQAYYNRLAVDVSFIAVPLEQVSPAMVQRGIELGVGILAIGAGSLRVPIAAVQGTPDAHLRSRVVEQLLRRRPRGLVLPASLLVREGPDGL